MNGYYSQMAERTLRELREKMVKALKALAEFEGISILPDFVSTTSLGYISALEFDAETGKTLCVTHTPEDVTRIDIDDDVLLSLDDIIALIRQLEGN